MSLNKVSVWFKGGNRILLGVFTVTVSLDLKSEFTLKSQSSNQQGLLLVFLDINVLVG